MSVQSSSPRSGSSAAMLFSWRVLLLWTVFAVTLVTGLVLAARFGAAAPQLLDVVSL